MKLMHKAIHNKRIHVVAVPGTYEEKVKSSRHLTAVSVKSLLQVLNRGVNECEVVNVPVHRTVYWLRDLIKKLE
jgi:hypothetical protein